MVHGTQYVLPPEQRNKEQRRNRIMDKQLFTPTPAQVSEAQSQEYIFEMLISPPFENTGYPTSPYSLDINGITSSLFFSEGQNSTFVGGVADIASP